MSGQYPAQQGAGTIAARAPDAIRHGGRLIAARAAYPAAPHPFIDLSTGINPHAYPLPPLPPDAWTRLPEPEAEAALRAVAAEAYGVRDPAMVAAAPGTQLLIALLPRLFPQRQVTVLGPTYAEHAAAWRAAGASVDEVADAAAWDAPSLVLCNPNNPDGRVLPPARVLALAETAAARGGVLVVDEAFADLEDGAPSVAPHLPHPALLVLRSFGKTYGLAGLRLGFLLAAPDRAAILRAALGPWAVSGPALAVARAALADADWRQAVAARLAADSARLDALFTRAGCRVAGGTRLFRLYTRPAAAALHDRLARAGLLTRLFETQPDWLRVGLPPDEAAWDRLQAVLTR